MSTIQNVQAKIITLCDHADQAPMSPEGEKLAERKLAIADRLISLTRVIWVDK